MTTTEKKEQDVQPVHQTDGPVEPPETSSLTEAERAAMVKATTRKVFNRRKSAYQRLAEGAP